MLCIFSHSRVCWNSWSTASWRHMAELSWTVLKKEVFTENTIQMVRKSRWGSIIMVALYLKVCCSSLSTASYSSLREYQELSQKRKLLSETYCSVSHNNWLGIAIIPWGCAFRHKHENKTFQDASRKQLTSCCSTSSDNWANRFPFPIEEKSRKLGTFLFEQFELFPLDPFRKQLTSCCSAL